jgi:hypothetical protein
MVTECSDEQLQFQGLGRRKVVADFGAGHTTSDSGLLLLREVAERTGVLHRLAACFTDYRSQLLIEHQVDELIAQRVFGLCLGYEDLNDHDTIRDDVLLAAAVGKRDPEGKYRRVKRDRGHGLAGKSTLNRLELTPPDADEESRYKKIVADGEAIRRFFVDVYLDTTPKPTEPIILDVDATDDPLYGKQEGRFFHGYYGHYCYLPLYIFTGDELLCAKLRPSNIDGAAGTLDELEPIVNQIRARWPDVEIILRGDSGFARDEIMAWCELNRVGYVLGLAKNQRLKEMLEGEQEQARLQCAATGKSARVFKELRYRTLKTWSRERRVVGKAEQLPGKANPRFVVTSLPTERFDARALYEEQYCARGDMENRIKEQQLGMFADRTSTNGMRSNQLRLWFSSAAYVLMNLLRRIGLKDTRFNRAQAGTIRTRLLKIGGIVKVSVRRIYVSISSAYPLKEIIAEALAAIALWRLSTA